MMNLIKRLPYLLRRYQLLNSSIFSFNTQAIPQLTNKQQYALTVYFAFIYIVNFKQQEYLKDPRPIYKRLSDQSHFGNFILEQSRKYHNITDLQALGLSKKNIGVVLRMFGQYPNRMDRLISSYYDSSQDLLFYPTIISGKIMAKILEGENLMINGPPGIGKSSTSKLYEYLSDYMIDCRMDKECKSFQKEPFRSILKDSYYYKMRKLVYISFIDKYQCSYSFCSLLEKNCGYLIDMKQSKNISVQSLTQNLLIVLREYKRRNIETTIFLDKSHKYYLYMNLLFEQRQWKANYYKDLEVITIFSQTFSMLKNTWTQLVISNKNVRTSLLIHQFIEEKGYCNIHAMQNPKMEIMDLQKVKFSLSIPGQIQLYQYLWLRIQQFIKDRRISVEQLHQTRLAFQQLFCLPNTKGNPMNKALVEWNRYVNLYNMKFSYKNQQLLQEITPNDIFYRRQNNTTDKIRQTLQKVKDNIQRDIKQYDQFAFNFVYHSSGPYDEEVRLAITLCLHYAARSTKGENRKKNHFKASLKHVENMYFTRPSPCSGYTLREHMNIVAKQYPIGFYDTDTQIMTIFYNPPNFQKETDRRKFKADRFKKIIEINCEILDKIYKENKGIELDSEKIQQTQQTNDSQLDEQDIRLIMGKDKDKLAIN